jgi:rhamnogalacturonan endolyase
MHPDIVNIRDHMPDHPGLEVFYLVETNPYAGAYMVDASTGAILWKSNRDDDPAWTHGHSGWTADIWDGSPGMECVCNRAGHADSNFILFSANGRRIMEQFPVQRPLEWDGDPTCELIDPSTFTIGDFDGQRIVPKPDGNPQRLAKGWLLAAADLCGDFRDELVVANKGPTGEPQISVIMASTPVGKRYVTARRTLDYRLWLARNIGAGYGCFYTQPLQAAP